MVVKFVHYQSRVAQGQETLYAMSVRLQCFHQCRCSSDAYHSLKRQRAFENCISRLCYLLGFDSVPVCLRNAKKPL